MLLFYAIYLQENAKFVQCAFCVIQTTTDRDYQLLSFVENEVINN